MSNSVAKIANIKITTNDIIKNWWKLNYFDGTSIIFTEVKYGSMYNGFAVSDERNIANLNFSIPTHNQMNIISGGGNSGAFNYMSTRMDPDPHPRWNSPNSATNSKGLNLLPAGVRSGTNGEFGGLGNGFFGWQSYDGNFEHYRVMKNYDIWERESFYFNDGYSVRLVNPDTVLSEGQSGIYVGNDGKVYPTKVINGIEIMTVNLCETMFRNGDNIVKITSDEAWASATIPAYCYPENNPNYV